MHVIEKIEVYKEEKPAPKKELPGSSLEKDLMSLLDDEDDEGSKNTIKKENQIEFTEIQSSPYRTLKLPKPIFKKNISDSNEKKKKPSFDMADDLLSLLDDD